MRRSPRFLLFLYSNRNIAGCVLGLLGLALFFLGIISQFWFLIVIGLYGIGALAAPANPTYELRFKNQMTIDDIRAELETLIKKIRRRVPQEVFDRVASIRDSIIDMLPHIVDISSSDYAIYTIRQTALDYLPETLENYLNLPPAFRQMHPVRNGKTARQILIEQLDLLDQEMKAIAMDFYRNDTQRLMAHGRFLEERFRQTDLWFDKPETKPSSPTPDCP
jgi:hypothetical protein